MLSANPPNTCIDRLASARASVIDRLSQVGLLVALVGAPASVSRSIYTGWLPIYSIHLGAAVAFVALFCFRARIPSAAKLVILILGFWSVGLPALFTYGILGGGFWWLALCSLLLGTLYSARAGVVSAVIVVLLLAIAAWGFCSGFLSIPVDANAYVRNGAVWASLLITTIAMSLIVFQSVSNYQAAAVDLLSEVNHQHDQLRQVADHDHLTGLPSLSLAKDRLEVVLHAARRSGKKASLFFIDLDDFKAVNDTFGHEVGDHVLKTVAERLMTVIRPDDTAARLGGDEFILIVGGLPDEKMAAQIAKRTIDTISKPIDHAGASISIAASIGIGLFPDHAPDAPSLQRLADQAMYVAKRSGKNRFAFAQSCAHSSGIAAATIAAVAFATDSRTGSRSSQV